jgi:hypothetical protein
MTNMATVFTADEITGILCAYGYPVDAVQAMIDSLVESGTKLQTWDGSPRLFTPGELLVLGDALRAAQHDRELRD